MYETSWIVLLFAFVRIFYTFGIIWTFQCYGNFNVFSLLWIFNLAHSQLWRTNTTFAIKQHGTPHKARETVLLSHRLSRSFDLKNRTVSPRRTATRCSVLDTLSMLHYCGSCSKQCNNERASISSVPRHPVVIHPLTCLWARYHIATVTHANHCILPNFLL